jgi:palmitoyl-protein thioesterase
MKLFFILLNFFLFVKISTFHRGYPVAIFHGIGDACQTNGMQEFTKIFYDSLKVYSKCIESGGAIHDLLGSSFLTQAQTACESIKSNSHFQAGFSVIGISQEALIARYIIEECEMKGVVKRYISIGGPQMGVAKIPHCETGPLCYVINTIISSAVYYGIAQRFIGPAGYFKAPMYLGSYLKNSIFLADLNNERESPMNSERKKRFLQLEKILLIKFNNDSMIIPKETAWFQFYSKISNEVEKLEESEFYKNDLIGLKQLIEEQKVKFVSIDHDHLQFSYNDIEREMFPILK